MRLIFALTLAAVVLAWPVAAQGLSTATRPSQAAANVATSLVESGFTVQSAVSGDMDGDGVDELAVVSTRGKSTMIDWKESHFEIFRSDTNGEWSRAYLKETPYFQRGGVFLAALTHTDQKQAVDWRVAGSGNFLDYTIYDYSKGSTSILYKSDMPIVRGDLGTLSGDLLEWSSDVGKIYSWDGSSFIGKDYEEPPIAGANVVYYRAEGGALNMPRTISIEVGQLVQFIRMDHSAISTRIFTDLGNDFVQEDDLGRSVYRAVRKGNMRYVVVPTDTGSRQSQTVITAR